MIRQISGIAILGHSKWKNEVYEKGYETKSLYLVDSEHLTIALLYFLQLPQKIPKTNQQKEKQSN